MKIKERLKGQKIYIKILLSPIVIPAGLLFLSLVFVPSLFLAFCWDAIIGDDLVDQLFKKL